MKKMRLMKKLKLLTIFLACLLASPVFAQTILEDGLKHGVGIRAQGMGGAFSAIADDLSAISYNPAGLSQLRSFSYSSGIGDIKNDAYQSNMYNLFNFWLLGYGNWNIINATGNTMNVSSYGFGKGESNGVNWGFAYKEIRYGNLPQAGLPAGKAGISKSFDFGLLLKISPKLSASAVVADLIPDNTINLKGSGKLGLAVKPFGESAILSADYEIKSTNIANNFAHIGIESEIASGLTLRTGVDSGSFTAGASINSPFFNINYAYKQDNTSPTQGIHSVGFDFFPQKLSERPFSITGAPEYALIEVGGKITGGRNQYSIIGGGMTGADGILRQIRRANKDRYIDGIMLKINGFQGGLATDALVQELRSDLIKFKKSGRKIVAYLTNGADGPEYYLAAVADKIVAPNGSTLGGMGKSIGVQKFGGLFDKFGIQWQTFTKGIYKDTFDSYGKKMAKEHREELEALLDSEYRTFISDISKDRKIPVEELKTIGDGRIFGVATAKKLNLVDQIGFFSDAKTACAKLSNSKDDVTLIKYDELENDEEYLFPLASKIAVIEVDGEIVTGTSGDNMLFGGRSIGGDDITEQLKQATDNRDVSAIILRVNSPGGSVTASSQIYAAVKAAREKGKVVVASFGDVAASGGYYISCPADYIIADPSSITGSIGVITKIPVIADMLKKIGVTVEVIKEGAHADMYSTLRQITKEEKKWIDDIMSADYKDFKAAVAAGRKIATSEVDVIAQGRIYTGSQALDLKLVDSLGNFSDAVTKACSLAKIRGEPILVYFKKGTDETNFAMNMAEKIGLKNGLLFGPQMELSEFKLIY